jgi:hypothetical protein
MMKSDDESLIFSNIFREEERKNKEKLEEDKLLLCEKNNKHSKIKLNNFFRSRLVIHS